MTGVQDCGLELRKSRVFDVFYTGGDYALNLTGDSLFTTCLNIVKVLNVHDGSEKYSIGDKDQEIRVTSFVLKEDNSEIIIAHANDVLKRYFLDQTTPKLLHQFRATHSAPILLMKWMTKTDGSSILATGSADFSVKIWDIKGGYCTHNFHGKFIVTSLYFINGGQKLLVGYGDGLLRMFNLGADDKQKKVLIDWAHHTSRITAIFSCPNNAVAVFSRDETSSIIDTKSLDVISVTPLFETIECAIPLPGNDGEFLTVGDQGVLKIWSFSSKQVVREVKVSRIELDSVIYCQSTGVAVCASIESDLVFVNIASLRIPKQFTGYNDEIFDVCFFSPKLNCLAVASNTPDLRIYNLNSFSCHLIQGHSESILSVHSPDWDDLMVATASKDNTVMIWKLAISLNADIKSEEPIAKNIALATGHTNSVTSVKFSHSKSHSFLITVSNDKTLKIWPLNGMKSNNMEIHKLTASSTFVAHSKDINSVDLSSNDKLCVTASMDKTAKLWHIDRVKMEFGIAGTLEGHKRGVWAAKFSKNLQIVATCSGDCTVKIFSLIDKSCLHTLSGHSFAVLSVLFVNKSSKLLSGDGGGLIKVWNLDKGICEKTIEAHSNKIWTMEQIERRVKSESKSGNTVEELKMEYITSGTDGTMVLWQDVSKEAKEDLMKERSKNLADAQSLSNFIQQEKYSDALLLTLDLTQPYQCLTVIKKILAKNEGIELPSIFKNLDTTQLSTLLDYASQWNTNTRTAAISQAILNLALRNIQPSEFLKLPNAESLVKAFLPYSNRHYERLSNLKTSVSFLDYVFGRMRLE